MKREDAVAIHCGTCGRGLRCVPDPPVGQTVAAVRWCHRCPGGWHTQTRVTVTHGAGRLTVSQGVAQAYRSVERL